MLKLFQKFNYASVRTCLKINRTCKNGLTHSARPMQTTSRSTTTTPCPSRPCNPALMVNSKKPALTVKPLKPMKPQRKLKLFPTPTKSKALGNQISVIKA